MRGCPLRSTRNGADSESDRETEGSHKPAHETSLGGGGVAVNRDRRWLPGEPDHDRRDRRPRLPQWARDLVTLE